MAITAPLCEDYKPPRKDGRKFLVNGKVILHSERYAWRVTKQMTKKEMRRGTYNEKFPIGPYLCQTGNHWHTGHSASNVGREPGLRIETELWIEDQYTKAKKFKNRQMNKYKRVRAQLRRKFSRPIEES